MTRPELYSTSIESLQYSLHKLLDSSGIVALVPSGKTILIKPNLVDLLDKNWQAIGHLQMANTVLSSAKTTVTLV